MIKYSYTLVLGTALLFASCATETTQDQDQDSEESTAQHEHSSEETLELDNGKKWVVVDEMMGHVQSMVTDLEQFENQEDKDYSDLASKLGDNIDLLTSSCTMTGKAHDQLHIWLLPYIDLVDELSSAEDDTAAKATYKEIQTSFETFNMFFE